MSGSAAVSTSACGSVRVDVEGHNAWLVGFRGTMDGAPAGGASRDYDEATPNWATSWTIAATPGHHVLVVEDSNMVPQWAKVLEVGVDVVACPAPTTTAAPTTTTILATTTTSTVAPTTTVDLGQPEPEEPTTSIWAPTPPVATVGHPILVVEPTTTVELVPPPVPVTPTAPAPTPAVLATVAVVQQVPAGGELPATGPSMIVPLLIAGALFVAAGMRLRKVGHRPI